MLRLERSWRRSLATLVGDARRCRLPNPRSLPASIDRFALACATTRRGLRRGARVVVVAVALEVAVWRES